MFHISCTKLPLFRLSVSIFELEHIVKNPQWPFPAYKKNKAPIFLQLETSSMQSIQTIFHYLIEHIQV